LGSELVSWLERQINDPLDGGEALASYRASLAIRERLAASDRSNSVWQHDGRDRMSTKFTDILYTEEKGVATVTINRPKVLNAFRAHTVEELIQAFLNAGWNKQIGVIVLTGIGDRAFSTGGDQSAHDGNYDGRGTNGMPIEELQSLKTRRRRDGGRWRPRQRALREEPPMDGFFSSIGPSTAGLVSRAANSSTKRTSRSDAPTDDRPSTAAGSALARRTAGGSASRPINSSRRNSVSTIRRTVVARSSSSCTDDNDRLRLPPASPALKAQSSGQRIRHREARELAPDEGCISAFRSGFALGAGRG
jgi:hypothetical protein